LLADSERVLLPPQILVQIDFNFVGLLLLVIVVCELDLDIFEFLNFVADVANLGVEGVVGESDALTQDFF